MSYVYILEKADYGETWDVAGVFTTAEAAMRQVPKGVWRVTETCDDGSQPWFYEDRYGEPCAWEIAGDWMIKRWELSE